MIFVGDVASPTLSHSDYLKKIFLENRSIFEGKSLVCNLEGLINDDYDLSKKTPILFNHSSVLDALKAGGIKAVGLANNHTLDLPGSFRTTVIKLEEHKIAHCGAGLKREDANRPARFLDGVGEVFLFNACWDFLLYHQTNPTEGIFLAEIRENKLLQSISKYRNDFPEASLVAMLHWSFDLEILPFPMLRQFSKALIDSGANLVVGAHSHCVQGGEKYKDGYIVYGLGNFFLPYNTFVDSYLSFPDFARIQLALEWDRKSGKAICHWFEYQNEESRHTLKHLSSEDFETSQLLKKYSPFSGQTNQEYTRYFKINRRKKLMIPVYTDYNKTFQNSLYTTFLKNRAKLARILAKYKIIKWQS